MARASVSDAEAAVRHLTTRCLATRWRCSPRTLERWRTRRIGPAWIVLPGGSIVCALADVLAWEQARRRGP